MLTTWPWIMACAAVTGVHSAHVAATPLPLPAGMWQMGMCRASGDVCLPSPCARLTMTHSFSDFGAFGYTLSICFNEIEQMHVASNLDSHSSRQVVEAAPAQPHGTSHRHQQLLCRRWLRRPSWQQSALHAAHGLSALCARSYQRFEVCRSLCPNTSGPCKLYLLRHDCAALADLCGAVT